jgi:hypothetical protein
MLVRQSRRRLPLRSPKASVRSSSTSTLPGGSPRGETSQVPSAAAVASHRRPDIETLSQRHAQNRLEDLDCAV